MDLAKERPSEWTKVPDFDATEIIYEKKYFDSGGVARISINRPDKMNALTGTGFGEICDALSEASHDHTVGVVVFTSVGDKAFCTGGDVKWEGLGGLRHQWEHPVSINRAIRLCRKPVIAAVKGWAIGGGNHWAYFCDFTIAAENAKFGQVGPRVGSPADGYLVAYLTRVIGAKRAREMWMLCRQYTAQEVLEMGLINKIVPLERLEEEVDQWCLELLGVSSTCLAIVKASFNADIDYLVYSGHHTLHLMYPDYLGSEEYMEGPTAFQEKRKPDWGKFRV
jgi:dihydroxynaphthoic acid synthetase